jgi:hypothetical protein
MMTLDPENYPRTHLYHNVSFHKFPEGKYDFSGNWMEPLASNLVHFRHFRDKPIAILEIGVMEGRSACWFFQEILTHPDSRYVGIDNWSADSEDWMINCRELATRNLEKAAQPVQWTLMEEDSSVALVKLQDSKAKFDIVYIDGGHSFSNCLGDTVLAWPLARNLVIWDDFRRAWDENYGVWRAVEWFLRTLPPQNHQIVFHNYQFGVQRFFNTQPS